MSSLRLFGTLARISRNNIKFCNSVYLRSMSTAQEQKHTKLRIVDNVGIILVDSPGVKIGCSVEIKRSDGRIHKALITAVDYSLNCVRVEWLEGNELKGKNIDFGSILALNSNQINKKSGKSRSHALNYYYVPHALGSRFTASTLTQASVDNINLPSEHEGLVITGKSFQYSQSCIDAANQKSELLDVPLGKKKRRTETESHTELLGSNQYNPNWRLQDMISDYCQKIMIDPLLENDIVEEHLITVCARKRPLNERELSKDEADIITVFKKNQLVVHEPRSKVDLTRYLENHFFEFDYVFNEYCTNAFVYKHSAQLLIKTTLEGGFATCFAYGQTGSGKTHTMCGDALLSDFGNNAEEGMYAMAARDMFKFVNSPEYRQLQLVVSASFFEIYSNKVLDLLNKKANLKVLEDSKHQINVVGLTEKVVGSFSEILDLIRQGSNARSSGQTPFSSNSSRSHAVFQLYLRPASDMTRIHGKFSLVDLAGNERGADLSLADKQTKQEGAEINKSLLALNECIRALGRKGAHIPFRVSKLTQILRDSFIKPNSRTCMIAMISPSVRFCQQTLNTLKYANRVKECNNIEGPISSSVEQYLSSSQVKYPLQSIAERSESSKHSGVTLKCPNDLELRVAEKKLIDNHVKILDRLLHFVQEGKYLLDFLHGDSFDPMEYCHSLEAIIEGCLAPLLIAKESLMEYKERINSLPNDM